MGRQREVYCKICMKTMRSDNLKTHLKQHQKKDIKDEYQENTIVERETNVNYI